MANRGYSLERIASHMYLTTEGILGIPLGVAATFIYLFILFGSFREKSGLGQLFIDIANAVAGWASGGPAKMAIVTSALEGTVSGSSVANTVESDSLTIPMMKRLGYRPEFAAAVEASSSTGGQIMPPIMGAAAFIMAEIIGVPYIKIVKAEKHERHLCEKCAADEGVTVKQHVPLNELLSGFLVSQAGAKQVADLTCPECGMTFVEYRNHGLLGCPNDYDVFEKALAPMIERRRSSANGWLRRLSGMRRAAADIAVEAIVGYPCNVYSIQGATSCSDSLPSP